MPTYTPNANNSPRTSTVVADSPPPNAAAINSPTVDALDLTAYIEAHGTLGDFGSMYPPISSGGPFLGSAPYSFVFVDLPLGTQGASQAWCVTGYSSGDITVYQVQGEDSTWTQVGLGVTNSNPATDIDWALSGPLWLASTDGANFKTWRMAVGSGTWTAITPAPTTSCTDAKLAQAPSGSGSEVYLAAGSSVAGDGKLGFGVGGGVTLTSGFTATRWLLESNGSYGVAIPAQAAASQQAFKSNAAGSTWTGNTIGLNASDVPVGLCWNAVQGIWLLAVQPLGANTGVNFWTSPDGVNWTLSKSLANTMAAQSVAAIGPFFFFLDSDGLSAPKMRLFGCRDGGVTWSLLQARAIGTDTTDIGQLKAGPHQLLMSPALVITGSSTSSSLRFSMNSGLATAVLT